jgi:hypothetical protein
MTGLLNHKPSVVQTTEIIKDNLNNFLITLCYIVMRLHGCYFTYYMREHGIIRQKLCSLN